MKLNIRRIIVKNSRGEGNRLSKIIRRIKRIEKILESINFSVPIKFIDSHIFSILLILRIIFEKI